MRNLYRSRAKPCDLLIATDSILSCFGKTKIPLTESIAERDVDPAMFVATHVYSPACWAPTESITNCFVRFPISDIAKSCRLESISIPSNIKLISSGESPLVTAHCTEAKSPAFRGSSPKENIPNCGATMER